MSVPKKRVRESDILALFDSAIANSTRLPHECRMCRVIGIERRPPQQGWSNWTYRLDGVATEACRSILDKIARELGAVYELE
jgi:hypothetical protein